MLWSRGFDGGGPQSELLRRLAHWLMKEPELEEEDLRTTVDDRHIRIERRSLERDGGTLQITTPSGDVETLDLTDEPRAGRLPTTSPTSRACSASMMASGPPLRSSAG